MSRGRIGPGGSGASSDPPGERPGAGADAGEGRWQLWRLATQPFDRLVLAEIERARESVRELHETFPGADAPFLCARLIEQNKALAGTGGAVTGLFGLAAVPADLLLITYLQLRVVVGVGVIYGGNLKGAQGHRDILEILGRGNGVGPVVRSTPPILARLAVSLFKRRGLPLAGRAVPFVASPLSAWLNLRDIDQVAAQAERHFGFSHRLARRGAHS